MEVVMYLGVDPGVTTGVAVSIGSFVDVYEIPKMRDIPMFSEGKVEGYYERFDLGPETLRMDTDDFWSTAADVTFCQEVGLLPSSRQSVKCDYLGRITNQMVADVIGHPWVSDHARDAFCHLFAYFDSVGIRQWWMDQIDRDLEMVE